MVLGGLSWVSLPGSWLSSPLAKPRFSRELPTTSSNRWRRIDREREREKRERLEREAGGERGEEEREGRILDIYSPEKGRAQTLLNRPRFFRITRSRSLEMGFWTTTRVLHMIRKPFERNESKKAAAAEACKSFDDSKEESNKIFEEKKEELHPKVLEIYESSSAEIKTVVKERTDAGLKKHAAAVNKFLEELVKIDFPGAKAASEASAKFGPAIVPGPVFFVFEKVASFHTVEEANKDAAEPPAADAADAEEAPPAPAEEGGDNEKEVAEVGEEKKVEEPKEEGKAPEAVPAAAPAATEATTSTSEAAVVIAAAVAVADTDDAVAPAPANKAAGEAPKA